MTESKVYVGNLPYSISEDELRVHFMQYGEINNIKIIIDFNTGRSKGFGFVTFSSEESSENALSANGKDLGGRKLKVNIAKEGGTRRDGRGSTKSNFQTEQY